MTTVSAARLLIISRNENVIAKVAATPKSAGLISLATMTLRVKEQACTKAWYPPSFMPPFTIDLLEDIVRLRIAVFFKPNSRPQGFATRGSVGEHMSPALPLPTLEQATQGSGNSPEFSFQRKANPASKQGESGKAWRGNQQKPHCQQTSKDLLATSEQVGLRRENGRGLNWLQGNVVCHPGTAQNFLAARRAHDHDGAARITAVVEFVPRVPARDIGKAPKTIRTQMAAGWSIPSKPSPRFGIRV